MYEKRTLPLFKIILRNIKFSLITKFSYCQSSIAANIKHERGTKLIIHNLNGTIDRSRKIRSHS